MEGVDHVHVLEIRRRRFISHVYRVLQRQIPDREGLELRVSRLASADVLVIQLGKACGQLAAAASRTGHNDQRFCYFNIRVRTVSFFAYDGINIRRVAFSKAVFVSFDAALFQFVDKLGHSRGIFFESCHNDTVDLQIVLSEDVDQSEHFQIVGDPEVRSCLIGCNVSGIDADDNLRLVLHLL